MADADDQKWMPLRVAIAWVFTLDLNFLIEFEKDSAPFWDALNKLDVSRADAVQPNPNVETIEDVWVALRDKIVAGKIELCGTPFKNENQRTESEGRHMSTNVGVDSHKSRRIGPNVASNLAIYEVPEEFQLKPGNGLDPGEWWWRQVQLSRANVLKQFEPSVFTPTILSVTESRQAKSIKMLSSALGELIPGAKGPAPTEHVLDEVALTKIKKTRVKILRAYMELRRSRGATFHSDVQRNEALRAHFNPGMPRKDAKLPSDSTIGRAFSDYKKVTGIDLT